ncbi:Dyp-type peroxidase [Nocardia terpenica]|uniref:Dyp-type peroxidase n=1 Tax=Nocardia terpenica TaxID=455432 RepID=UPI001894D8B1|nr:Dyp-type peroxidase [Nocardia terpenica]MBF6060306.1 Dyp-type peroxidase [Nocardia terpenica]MBF6103566.1 Dyp-type peroxidase [Nocardia terpenica]MBF6112060.1 Dyp-type peroxidase [Nocardia terpenica]MBF6117787.1 Dyp-type peroxidase [Nocardia terpenica]MBF6153469.1 Dyp-type peroxidase [Nocardia terpenica]
MGESQPILDPLSRAAMFLVVTIDDGGEPVARDLLADLPGLRRSVGFRVPGADLHCIVGIGSAAWDRLFAGPKPAELHDFPGYAGERHRAPATPGDLLFHLKADAQDACFELAMTIADRLRGAATIVDETVGFRYFEQRDLLGFVDGTENPEGRLAAGAALVGAEDPEFAGGSYVVVQKYLHDLDAWNALPTREQERVIGRTKLDDFELSDADKPANSHVAVNTLIDPDGTERQILRANMPFGSVRDGEFGTYYVAYAATPSVTERMLTRMFLGSEEAAYDRILDFSTAVTGTLFFAPTVDFLDELPDPPDGDAPAADDPAPPTGEGSLGIGTLKRSTP